MLTTSAVSPASLSARVSPTQRMTLREASRAALVLVPTSSDVSWNHVRRSECPKVYVFVDRIPGQGRRERTENDVRDLGVSELRRAGNALVNTRKEPE